MNAHQLPAEPSLTAPKRGRVLVVDDEEGVSRLCARCLSGKGFTIETASNGAEALRALQSGGFDVVLSDVAMPVLDGLSLSREVERAKLDVAIVLMTAIPLSAKDAIDSHAVGFLAKPLDLSDLVKVVDRAHQVSVRRRMERDLIAIHTSEVEARCAQSARLDQALRSLYMAHQPIVDCNARCTFAWEALVRVEPKLYKHPGELFDAAEELARVREVGRQIRRRVAADWVDRPQGPLGFVNLHPLDLADDELYDRDAPLSRLADRIVLEITERASLAAIPDLKGRLRTLRAMGYRIAIDDLGAGYAALSSLATIEPEVLKIDGSLIRNIDASATQRRLVQSVISLAEGLGTLVVAECVETPAERDTLLELGCTLFQGYLFAKPAPAFPQPVY